MNGTKERVYSRIVGVDVAGGPDRTSFRCPFCSHIVHVTGDSQNYGAVRRHLNVHVKERRITEAQKVEFVKAAGI